MSYPVAPWCVRGLLTSDYIQFLEPEPELHVVPTTEEFSGRSGLMMVWGVGSLMIGGRSPHTGTFELCCQMPDGSELKRSVVRMIVAPVDFSRPDLCQYCAARALEELFP